MACLRNYLKKSICVVFERKQTYTCIETTLFINIFNKNNIIKLILINKKHLAK